MAKLLTAQRRVFLFVGAVIFTFVIRLISFSFGHTLREGRSAIVLSDRGQFKQVAIRIAKLQSANALRLRYRLGLYDAGPSISYLLRIANFFPFIMLDNLDGFTDANVSSLNSGSDLLLLGQSCDGDASDGSDSCTVCDGDGLC
jgi:hypothetical protein